MGVYVFPSGSRFLFHRQKAPVFTCQNRDRGCSTGLEGEKKKGVMDFSIGRHEFFPRRRLSLPLVFIEQIEIGDRWIAQRSKAAACTRLVGQLMRRSRAAVLADKCAARAGRGTRGRAHRTAQTPCPQHCEELSHANSAGRELASLAPSFVAAAGGPGDFAPHAARVARSSGRFRGRPPPKGGLAPFCGGFALP